MVPMSDHTNPRAGRRPRRCCMSVTHGASRLKRSEPAAYIQYSLSTFDRWRSLSLVRSCWLPASTCGVRDVRKVNGGCRTRPMALCFQGVSIGIGSNDLDHDTVRENTV